MKLFLIDLKRIFSGWGTALLYILAPVFVMLALSLVAVPLFVTAKVAKFSVLVCDEDKSEPVRTFVTQLVNSKALKDLVVVYPVDTPEKGHALISSGDATIFIHIPPKLFENMQNKREVIVNVYAAPGHELEASIIRDALSDSLAVVGKSENILQLAYWSVLDAGASLQESEDFFYAAIEYGTEEYMNRTEVFGDMGTISPLGDMIPVQYYFAAVYTLFAALAALPLARKTAGDLSGVLLMRGVLSNQSAAKFFLARFCSGEVLILLLLLTLIPAQMLINLANASRNSLLVGSLAALLCGMALIACCFSAFATALPRIAHNKDTAVWAGFFAVLLLACGSGLFIPERLLPEGMVDVMRFFPLSASLHILSSAFFRFDIVAFLRDSAVLLFWCVLFLLLGYWGYRKRERAL